MVPCDRLTGRLLGGHWLASTSGHQGGPGSHLRYSGNCNQTAVLDEDLMRRGSELRLKALITPLLTRTGAFATANRRPATTTTAGASMPNARKTSSHHM